MNSYGIFFTAPYHHKTKCYHVQVMMETMQGAINYVTRLYGYRYEIRMIVVNRWDENRQILRKSQVSP